MISKLLRRRFARLAAVLTGLCCTFAHAGNWDYTDAYSHGGLWAKDLTQPSWMKAIGDDRPLLSLSIPGTHDSASVGYGGDAVQNQSMSIPDQLRAGIRYLDFRCRLDNGDLQFHHGFVWMHKTCASGFADVASFLAKHPSETVLIKLQQEYSERPNAELQAAFDPILATYAHVIWQGYNETQNPRLGEVRGKIVIVKRFNERQRNGLTYNDFNILDNYEMGTNWDLYSHWSRIKSRLASMTPSPYGGYITHIVGSGGSFPYFVASGRSSPDGGHLVTGLTTPGWSGSYPDFPRDSCFIGICSIYFKGLNELTAEYLKTRMPAFAGIVVADFPGRSLIDAIIERNAKTWRQGDVARAGDVYVYNNPYTHLVEYFAAKRDGAYWYFPIDGRDNNDWILLGNQFPAGRDIKYWVHSAASAVGDIYAYRNPFTHSIDYFRAKKAGYYAHQKLWFPTNQSSNAYWEFIRQEPF